MTEEKVTIGPLEANTVTANVSYEAALAELKLLDELEAKNKEEIINLSK